MIIVLLGYMGSGKSTIGKELATILSYSFLDLDDYISDKEKSSITDIFKSKGEIYFRRKETEYLHEVLSCSDNIVLALGGGTPCYSTNMQSILNKPKVISFYLKLSIPLLVERLFKEREKRPLISHLNEEADLLEFIGKHLFERSQYYSKAKHILNTDNKSSKETVENILIHLI